MKKILLIILLIILIISGIIMIYANKVEKMSLADRKVLIAYFSWSGNTKYIAEKINTKVRGDIFRIETKIPYPTDYNETAYGIAKKQHDENIHPEIKDNCDISNYDVIFVGTPAWWYTMAPPVMTFLENNNFEGKTIVPFVTHGGGGGYNIAEDIKKLSKNATVLPPLIVYGKGNLNTDNEIDNWLHDINLK